MDYALSNDEKIEVVGAHSISLSKLNDPLPSIDSFLCRKLRVSFCILTSLGTKKMYLWCPRYHHISPRRKSIEVGSYNISIRTHLYSEYEEIAPLIRASDIAFKKTYSQLKQAVAIGIETQQSLCSIDKDPYVQKQKFLLYELNNILEKKVGLLGRNAPAFVRPPGHVLPPPPKDHELCDQIYFDVFYKSNSHRFQNEQDAVEYLEEKFSLTNKDIFEPFELDRKNQWHLHDSLMGAKTSVISSANEKTIIAKIYNNSFLLFPWSYGPCDDCYFFPTYAGLLPLFNQHMIEKNETLYLTSSIEYAQSPSEEFSPTISWCGGDATIPYIDWQKLQGKRVLYLLSGDNKDNFITAIKVSNVIKKIVESFIFLYCDENDRLKFDDIESLEEKLGYKFDKYNINIYDTKQKKVKREKDTNETYTIVNDSRLMKRELMQPPFSICDKSISMLYSSPGAGKTWFSLSFAYAVSLGKPFCNKWTSSARRKVLYIDGEMGEHGLKERLQIIEKIYSVPAHENDLFHCMSLNTFEIELSKVEGQDIINSYIMHNMRVKDEDRLFIIIDNILSVTQYSDHGSSWISIYTWLKELQTYGATVLFIHHSNKSGEQRGTSIKTAAVDNVIRLSAKEKIKERKALEITLTFEKGRYLSEKMFSEYELSLDFNNNSPRWHDKNIYSARKDQALLDELLKASLHSGRFEWQEISEKTGYQRAAIYRRRHELQEEMNDQHIEE